MKHENDVSPCFVTDLSHDRAIGLACCSSPDFIMCITQSLSYLPKIPAGKGELSGPRPLPGAKNQYKSR